MIYGLIFGLINDIVYIDATGLTRWQRIMNQIVPFSSALYTFDQLGKN